MTLRTTLFWIAAACCVVAQAGILRSVFAGQGRQGLERPRRVGPVEIAWAVLPAIALALVLFATWRALDPSAPSAPSARAGAPAGV